ncbi:glycosyltransferase family 2 protein [Motilimonas eburnea]|uniref:glycosyltransferase family 2 protein n=1 Tax=Motilimonas eburnea TaxID=1737488 RepID=UPI001E5EA7FD|nr:glycosyltransferase family 2 protein [Motilimonas eburnea]MCE2571531.1 glycosyltransferase family 2 protein [Motilimonas eburnea]
MTLNKISVDGKVRTLLFGAGPLAESIFNTEQAQREFIAVIDNNSALHGKEYLSLPVISPQQLSNYDYDEILITTSWVNEVREQLLEELNIESDKIVVPKNQITKQLKPFVHKDTFEIAVRLFNDVFIADELASFDIMADFDTLLSLRVNKNFDAKDSVLSFSLPYKQIEPLKEKLLLLINRYELQLDCSLNLMKKNSDAPIALIMEATPKCNNGRRFTFVFRGNVCQQDKTVDLPSRGIFYSPNHFHNCIITHTFGDFSFNAPQALDDYLNFLYDDWQTNSAKKSLVDYRHRGLLEAFEHSPNWPDDLAGLFAGDEDVSVVTAVYNHQSTLAESLDSALLQLSPYRIHSYCFNDASTDDSGYILDLYKQKFSDRMTVYTSPTNQGSGKKSYLYHRPDVKGRYWSFLAGDDYWLDMQKVYLQTTYLDYDPKVLACCCDTIQLDPVTQRESIIAADALRWNRFDLIINPKKLNLYTHTSSLLWRNVWRDTKGFFLPPDFERGYAHGDVMLAFAMLSRGGEIHRLERVMNCYRYTGQGVWSSLSRTEQNAAQRKVKIGIQRLTPISSKILVLLQPLRKMMKFFWNIIPGPVN